MAKEYRSNVLQTATFLLAICSYGEQVFGAPITDGNGADAWPFFNKRNIGSLARDGYVRSNPLGYKRSISTLAKNGQLPTFRSPYDETDKQEDDGEPNEKRNIASIARLRSFAAMKRNIQALARDGYKGGRGGQYTQQSDKRNIQSLARNGLIHKRDDQTRDEYYYPFYQNSIPPLSEIDGPLDYNEIYDLQQSINPDLFPPLSQIYKRSFGNYYGSPLADNYADSNADWYNKRVSLGSPVHGIFRSTFTEPASRSKRYIFSIPDVIDGNDVPAPENDDYGNQDKRSVGSIPMTRISELGNISLVPKLNQQSIQTTPTYRRKHYLLTRTRPEGSSTDR